MDKDSIRLVNIVPVVNGWKTAALENKGEAQKLMTSGNIPDYNAGLVKSAAADLVAGMAEDLLKAPVIDPETLRPTVEPSNRWVRTADRMPDIPGDEKSWAHVSVIAAERGSKKSSPMIYERAVIRGKTVYRWKYVWDRIYDGNGIFAWMPYPEAPKEEENE